MLVSLADSPAASSDSHDAGSLIQPAKSLREDGVLSRRSGRPIVIFFSQAGCEYCQALRRNVLHPMLRSGDADRSMILREVSLDAEFRLDGFDGESTSGSEFAQRYSTTITPTLLFVDSGGSEIAERRVGIGNIEFYSFYLDRAISAAAEVIADSP